MFLEFEEEEAANEILKIEGWVNRLPHKKNPLTDLGAQVFSPPLISKLEEYVIQKVEEIKKNKEERKKEEKEEIIEELFDINQLRIPITDILTCNPNLSHPSQFSLGDRVSNLIEDRNIAFGCRGTVIGVNNNVLMVLWDDEFIGGETYFGSKTSRIDKAVLISTVVNCTRYNQDSLWSNSNNKKKNLIYEYKSPNFQNFPPRSDHRSPEPFSRSSKMPNKHKSMHKEKERRNPKSDRLDVDSSHQYRVNKSSFSPKMTESNQDLYFDLTPNREMESNVKVGKHHPHQKKPPHKSSHSDKQPPLSPSGHNKDSPSTKKFSVVLKKDKDYIPEKKNTPKRNQNNN